ncbi:ABC transporter substrate-binding protein [Actinomadura sp. SCN-SB]|uniref:ABC transporter substrate-binding protein n=1 Tax=Actinomadura sp. SCN-SB TaxID=3373092 RepID=UPI0037519515
MTQITTTPASSYTRRRNTRGRTRLLSASIVLSLGAALLSACGMGQAGGTGGEAHIALVLPISGPFSRQGNLVKRGAEMAADEINAAGGLKALGGAKIVLDAHDAGGTVETAVSAANRALARNRPTAGIGAWASSLTLGVTEVAERKRVPWLTVSFADQITARGFTYVYQTSPVSSLSARDGLKGFQEIAADAGHPVRTVALVGDNTAASQGFLDAVKTKVAPALGLKVITTQQWTPPLREGSSIANALVKAKPDAIIYSPATFSDSSVALRAFDQFGVDAPIIGNGAALVLPEYLKNLGGNRVEGLMTVVGGHPGKGTEDLVSKFSERTGEPFMTQDALSGYYHVWLIKEAIEAAKSSDPTAVNNALKRIDLREGPAATMSGGRVRFDESGRRKEATPLIVQWQDGKPVTVWPADAAVAKPEFAG